MLKELTVKEVEAILSKDNNVSGLGYTGPKGATRFVNELRQQVNELTTKLS